MFICPLDINIYFMARIFNSIPGSNDSSISRNPLGSVQSSEVIDATGLNVAEDNKWDVRNSPAYQEAYSLFSSLSDQSWMTRLNAIINSNVVGSQTFLDQLGLSNNFVDQLRDNYNHQVTQIQNLIAEYQKYKHELPITTVQQMADAGYNSSITGVGLSGASVNPTTYQSTPTTTSSVNPLEGISSIANVATSLSGGILSIADTVNSIFKNVNDVNLGWRNSRISEASFASGLWQSLINEGYNVGSQPFRTLEEFDNFSKLSDVDDAFMKKMVDARNAYFKSYEDGAQYEGFSSPSEYLSFMRGQEFSDFYRSIADYEMQTKVIKSYADYLRSGVDAYVAENLDPEMASLAANYKVESDAALSGIDTLVANIQASYINDWVDLFNKTQDPVAKYSILKTIFEMDLDDQMHMELIEKLGSATTVNATIGAVKVGADILSSAVKSFSKIKKPFKRTR